MKVYTYEVEKKQSQLKVQQFIFFIRFKTGIMHITKHTHKTLTHMHIKHIQIEGINIESITFLNKREHKKLCIVSVYICKKSNI